MPRTPNDTGPDRQADAMAEATALTRSGRLAEATRAIQAALGANRADAGTAHGTDGPGGVIEGEVIARKRATPRPAAGAGTKPTAAPRATATATRATPTGASRATPTGTAGPGVAESVAATLARMHSASSRAPTTRSRGRAKLRPATDMPVPDGARWEWRTARDGRRYRLYVPAALADSAPSSAGAPLVVMLHGCTQSPDDFALGTRMNAAAEAHGAVVAYPEQTRAANPMACWNWFEPAHQGGGEAASIAALTEEVRGELSLGRAVVAGLSAGGAMAAILGRSHPELFGAVGIHSGLPAGAARDLTGAQRAMATGVTPRGRANSRTQASVRTVVVHGDADRTVHPANGAAAFKAAAGDLPRSERGEGTARVVTATGPDGRAVAEHWRVPGLAHAWAGGDARGSYTDPEAVDATGAMLRFMLG